MNEQTKESLMQRSESLREKKFKACVGAQSEGYLEGRGILDTTWPSGSSMSHTWGLMDTWAHATIQDELSPHQSPRVRLAKAGKDSWVLQGDSQGNSPSLHDVVDRKHAVAHYRGLFQGMTEEGASGQPVPTLKTVTVCTSLEPAETHSGLSEATQPHRALSALTGL